MKKYKLFDIVKLVVSLILIVCSIFIFFTTYQQKKARSETICDVGAIFKDEQSPYEYKGNVIITEVGVKAGTACTFFKVNSSTECYEITGLGTTNVTVKQIRNDNVCQGISHVSFFSTQQQISPTPTQPLTLSPTPTTPGQLSNTPTPSPIKSSTPTPSTIPSTTPSKTPTPSRTRTPTPLPSDTPAPTETLALTATPQPSNEPSNTPTEIPTLTKTSTPNPSATLTSQPGVSNTPTEIILVNTTVNPTNRETTTETSSNLPTVGTITGWIIVAIPLALVILAFVF